MNEFLCLVIAELAAQTKKEKSKKQARKNKLFVSDLLTDLFAQKDRKIQLCSLIQLRYWLSTTGRTMTCRLSRQMIFLHELK